MPRVDALQGISRRHGAGRRRVRADDAFDDELHRTVDQGRRAAAHLVGMCRIGDQAQRGVGRDVPQGLAAERIAVPVIDVRSRNEIGDEAVARLVGAVDTQRQPVRGHRQVDATAEIQKRMLPDGSGDPGAGGEIGRLRIDADRAGRGVAPEQGALRAAQHFDPLEAR
jgi:hypothetical protein